MAPVTHGHARVSHLTHGSLSDEQLGHFRDEGYLLLRHLIEPWRIEAMRVTMDELVDRLIGSMKEKGLISDVGSELPLETRLYKVAGVLADQYGRSGRGSITSRALYDLHHDPGIVRAIEQITGTDVLGHPVWNYRPKLPHQALTIVPWHQDSGYFGKESDKSQILTVWIPLVKTTIQNGCLQVLPGSHKQGLIEHRTETRAGGFLEVVADLDESKALNCEMELGDALIFDNLMFHRSLPNESDVIRWSLDLRYYRDGDWPGAIYWNDPQFTWVIRSATREVTPFEAWEPHARKL